MRIQEGWELIPVKVAKATQAKGEVKTVKGVWKGNKRQISITLAPEVLDRVDELSRKLGQSRAAVIGMAVYRAVEHGLLKD